MMKNQVVFAVLSLLAVHASGAVLEPEKIIEPVGVVDAVDVSEISGDVQLLSAVTHNLSYGQINVGDQLLHRSYYNKGPVANTAQSQDITYRGNARTRITAVFATRVGQNQYGSAQIIAGGINSNFVTVRLFSSRGYGYSFSFQVWGRL